MQTFSFAQLMKQPLLNLKSNANNTGSILGNEPDWKLTKHATPGILAKLSRTSKIIGKKSTFGIVKKLLYGTSDNTYVIKFVKFSPMNANREFSFMTEVKIGSLRRIGAVGPRVIAYRKTMLGGEFVMDNVEMGQNVQSLSIANKRIRVTPALWTMIKETIQKFYKITKGYHGDLHGDNIMIILHKNHYTIKIIDYGAHRRFNFNLGNIIDTHYGAKVYRPGGVGQKFIHNKNFLNVLKMNKGIIN